MRLRIAPALSVSLALVYAPGRAFAQCADPAVPAGGFAILQHLDLQHTYTDGYRVRFDVRFPADPPGACGWPLVVLVHGGGGSKQVVAADARDLAAAGYATCSYDVRGQGPSMAANPLALAHDGTGLRELIDLFEAMEAAEAHYPAAIDFARIGVTGYSQGGHHSWWAAQHSGLLPPANPWRTAAFPAIGAVSVRDAGGGGAGGSVPAFKDTFVENFFAAGDIAYQPAFVAAMQPLILAEDFAGIAALVTVQGMDPSVLLPSSAVPVFAHASYDDKRIDPSAVFASWSLLPAGTPKRLQLGTSGHDSPDNVRDRALYEQTRERWFDRFLKGEPNGVDLEPRVFAGITPDSVAKYLDPASLWDFRTHDDLPGAAAVLERAYLGAGGLLLPAAPAGASASSLQHAVPAALDMAAYAASLPNAAGLAAMIPRDTIAYDSSVLVEDRLLQGVAAVSLAVDTGDPDYQIHAVLYDVAPNGSARYVADGAAAVRGSPGQSTHAISLYLQSYVFRAGHRIRLQLENLVIHSPPTGSAPEIRLVPCFASSTVAVLEGGAAPSYIDLPLLPFAAPTLSTFPPKQSVALPQHQKLAIHSNSAHAGEAYALLPSLSGTAPGTWVAGALLPLNFDALTLLLLGNPGLPPFANAFGALDAEGSALPGVLLEGLPLPPALVGFEVTYAALTASAPTGASNAVTVPFVD